MNKGIEEILEIGRSTNFAYRDLRPDHLSHERNDCGVVAVMFAAGISYADAHAAMKECGRKDKKISYLAWCIKVITDNGHHCERITPRSKTIRTFVREAKADSVYLIRVTGHLLCVRGKEICDWAKRKQLKRITHVYLVS